ncbi:hypothetical protein L6164_015365 [Bauhinia variegata]|uniref:Uncharacterized protein n=1 Tax=Bauhinia variegata TaxID=167791 RepID=A0ACB9NLD4_BAUVA|nr:hypothetical protein L6164_015365 [Bauhinia variegata]
MWDVYIHRTSIRLPRFWLEAFQTAYEHLVMSLAFEMLLFRKFPRCPCAPSIRTIFLFIQTRKLSCSLHHSSTTARGRKLLPFNVCSLSTISFRKCPKPIQTLGKRCN